MPPSRVNAYLSEAFSIVTNPFIGFAGRIGLLKERGIIKRKIEH
jgi:hypothetical protein